MELENDGIVPEMNPLEINLILEKVLNFLELKPLLECRLVSRGWNSAVIKILGVRKCTIRLDGSNIRDYVKLVHNTRKAMNVAPLPEDEDEAGSSLGSSVEGEKETPMPPTLNFSIIYGKSATSSNKIADCALELVKSYGNCCITSFSYHTIIKSSEDVEYGEWVKILKLLQVISLGLERLFIFVQAKLEHVYSLQDTTLQDPCFPSLTDFHYGQIHVNPTMFVQIVNASPRLSNLILKRRLFDEGLMLEAGYRHITKAFTNILALPLQKLEFFQISTIDFLNTALLVPYQYNHLKKLKLCIENGVHDVNTASEFISQFLRSKCATALKSLEFEFIPHSNSFVNEFPNNLPNLAIEHFGYYINWSYCIHHEPNFIRIDNLVTVPAKWPCLKSVTTSLGTCVYISHEFDDFQQFLLQEDQQNLNWYDNVHVKAIQFPTVTDLNLNLRFSTDFRFKPDHIGFPISLRENINQLHILYPNVRKVVVDNQLPKEHPANGRNEGPESPDGNGEKTCQLQIILMTLLEEIPGIEELEITNYYEDWLGSIIGEMKLSADKLSCLKVLRFPALGKPHEIYPTLDIDVFLQHAPVLQLIEANSQFFLEKDRNLLEMQTMRTREKGSHMNVKIKLI